MCLMCLDQCLLLNSGVKFRVSLRPGLWNRLNYPANCLGFPDSLTLEHLENGQRVIGAWGRTAEGWWWVGLGQTHRDEGSLTEEAPSFPNVSSPRSLQTGWHGHGFPASCFLPLQCLVGALPLLPEQH